MHEVIDLLQNEVILCIVLCVWLIRDIQFHFVCMINSNMTKSYLKELEIYMDFDVIVLELIQAIDNIRNKIKG